MFNLRKILHKLTTRRSDVVIRVGVVVSVQDAVYKDDADAAKGFVSIGEYYRTPSSIQRRER